MSFPWIDVDSDGWKKEMESQEEEEKEEIEKRDESEESMEASGEESDASAASSPQSPISLEDDEDEDYMQGSKQFTLLLLCFCFSCGAVGISTKIALRRCVVIAEPVGAAKSCSDFSLCL
jgi:hypothetical protein